MPKIAGMESMAKMRSVEADRDEHEDHRYRIFLPSMTVRSFDP